MLLFLSQKSACYLYRETTPNFREKNKNLYNTPCWGKNMILKGGGGKNVSLRTNLNQFHNIYFVKAEYNFKKIVVNGKPILLLSVPQFSSSRAVVQISLHTLEPSIIEFESQLEISNSPEPNK